MKDSAANLQVAGQHLTGLRFHYGLPNTGGIGSHCAPTLLVQDLCLADLM